MGTLTIRDATPADLETLFDIRARTRENAISRAYLESIGITAESWAAGMRSGTARTWVCCAGEAPIGFSAADATSGEVLVLAVLPEFEGRGAGKGLLDRAVGWLRSQGCGRIWLATNPDPAGRAFGFYRSQGWRPTGEMQEKSGDEILELRETQ